MSEFRVDTKDKHSSVDQTSSPWKGSLFVFYKTSFVIDACLFVLCIMYHQTGQVEVASRWNNGLESAGKATPGWRW